MRRNPNPSFEGKIHPPLRNGEGLCSRAAHGDHATQSYLHRILTVRSALFDLKALRMDEIMSYAYRWVMAVGVAGAFMEKLCPHALHYRVYARYRHKIYDVHDIFNMVGSLNLLYGVWRR